MMITKREVVTSWVDLEHLRPTSAKIYGWPAARPAPITSATSKLAEG